MLCEGVACGRWLDEPLLKAPRGRDDGRGCGGGGERLGGLVKGEGRGFVVVELVDVRDALGREQVQRHVRVEEGRCFGKGKQKDAVLFPGRKGHDLFGVAEVPEHNKRIARMGRVEGDG